MHLTVFSKTTTLGSVLCCVILNFRVEIVLCPFFIQVIDPEFYPQICQFFPLFWPVLVEYLIVPFSPYHLPFGFLTLSFLSPSHPSTVILAPLVGGITGSTIFPLLMATILAYCTTGYVRDELFHPLVKSCVGACCSSLVSYI